MYVYSLFLGFPSHLGNHRALGSLRLGTVGSHQLSILYIVSIVYICRSQSPNASHSHTPFVFIYLFSTPVSLFLLCKYVHLYCFSRFHIYVLIHDICFSFSHFTMYDSLLGPSTSLQMAQFHSFFLAGIPLYIYITSALSIPLLMNIQVTSMCWLL